MGTGNALLLHKFSQTPWAIHPSMFDVFTNVFNNKLQGRILKPAQVKDDNDGLMKYTMYGSIAVLDLEGVILKKKMMMEGESGMFATLDVERTLLMAMEDRAVESIILSIDSPGGTIDGAAELADLIYSLRGEKPMTALANGMMCSAAYWIGSAADKIYAYTTSDVGSIGVYMMHIDQSKANESEGIKVTYIKAGKYKTVGNPNEPLSDTDKDVLQAHVDYNYDTFISAVARNRGMSKDDVAKVAEGRLFIGQQAVDAGLVDQIASLDDLVEYSNKYQFLKGGRMLGKKVKDATVEDLKADNPELYQQIVAETTATVQANCQGQISALQAQIAESDAQAKRAKGIRASALKLGQVAEGEVLVASDKSLEDCLVELISGTHEASGDLGNAFAATAPVAAGSAAASELDLPEPKTQEAAMQYCLKKYGCSKREAWAKASLDFAELFGRVKK